MQRKMKGLFATLIAFGALALVPAIGSAHGILDTSGGNTTTVGVGERIVGYNDLESTVKFNAGGLVVECDETTLTGKVHANPHTTNGAVQGTIEHAYFRGSDGPETKCASTLGTATITIPDLTQAGGTGDASHWCIRTAPESDTFEVEGRGCTTTGTRTFTFLLHAGGTTCGYTRTNNLVGHFDTVNHEATTWSLDANQGLTKHVGGILCPASGTLVEFDFEMFTDTDPSTPGTWRHAGSVADPIWIT